MLLCTLCILKHAICSCSYKETKGVFWELSIALKVWHVPICSTSKKEKKPNNPKTSHSFHPFVISSWVLSTTTHVWPWEDYINIFTNTTSTNQSRYFVLFKTGLDPLSISLCLAYKHFSKNHTSHCSILKEVIFLVMFGKRQPYFSKII